MASTPRAGARTGDALFQRGQALRHDRVVAALGDDERALIVVTAIDADHQAAEADAHLEPFAVDVLARDAEPQHVHRGAELLGLQAKLLANRGEPAVAGHGEPGRDLLAVAGDHPGDGAVGVAPQRGHLGGSQQGEAGVARRLVGQQVEEVPLRDEHQVAVAAGQPGEVGHGEAAVGEGHPQLARLASGQLGRLLLQPQLFEEGQRRGVHGVAAEVPEEIGVLLQDHDIDILACQQKPEHQTSRTASDHTHLCLPHGHHSKMDLAISRH